METWISSQERFLKEFKHSLLLQEMMQDYRNEIKDFFAVDKQLAAELEYDMKKYEEQLGREKESDQEHASTLQAEVVGTIKFVRMLSLLKKFVQK